jgi:hypothetical protein
VTDLAEAAGHVRPERVNTWPHCMTDDDCTTSGRKLSYV